MVKIWDNGELVLVMGNLWRITRIWFAGYTMDWWASDLLEFISNQNEADELAGLLGVNSNDLPMDFLLLKQARMSNSTQEKVA